MFISEFFGEVYNKHIQRSIDIQKNFIKRVYDEDVSNYKRQSKNLKKSVSRRECAELKKGKKAIRVISEVLDRQNDLFAEALERFKKLIFLFANYFKLRSETFLLAYYYYFTISEQFMEDNEFICGFDWLRSCEYLHVCICLAIKYSYDMSYFSKPLYHTINEECDTEITLSSYKENEMYVLGLFDYNIHPNEEILNRSCVEYDKWVRKQSSDEGEMV
jgi:hypothetical protein